MVALHLAIRHPDVVERLVLCCTSPGGDAPSYPLHELASMDPDELAGLGRQMTARRGHDVVAQLGSISAPTLVCAGRHDGIAPVANSELLVERIPNARLRVFEGGHYFLVQDRSAYPAIIDFLLAPTVQ